MGNTCTSLHLLKPVFDTRKLDREIKSAYKQLGYEPARNQANQQKRVVLVEQGGDGEFLTIYDSDNSLIDTGELKQLAVSLSKKLKTAAVLTSIYDSDGFEFIVFNKGKQIDAVVSDPDDHAAGLKMLKDSKRHFTWKDIFISPAAVRAMLTADAATDGTTRMAAVLERERAFDERMRRVGEVAGAFAENGLGACCEAAGLDGVNVLTRRTNEDVDAPGATVLMFEKLASAADQAAPAQPTGREIKLTPFISDDDWIAPKYFPAVWPIAEGERAAVRWLVTSTDAGFSGLKFRVELPDAPPTLAGKLSVQALPFYNGQITTANAVAFAELSAPALSDGAWTFDIASFAVPDLDPQTRKQIILVLVLEVDGTGADVVCFRPTLATTVPTPIELRLPPARLQRQKPTWVPRAADMSTSATAASVLTLNAPTVLSMTALIQDEPATLAQVRVWAEAWLAAHSAAEGRTLCIQTQKHMSASFRVAKSEKTVPLSNAASDKQWPKLFDAASQYQTVMLRVMRAGDLFPVAGFTWQGALRDDLRPDPEQALRHVRDAIAPYLRAADHAHPLDSEGGTAVAVSAWSLNHPAVFAEMGTTPSRLSQMFDGWMADQGPVQAWITRSAWIPEFDVYENYHQTPYEVASSVDWFRSGLNGLLAQRAWACRRLRFVAPTMWLGKELTGMIDIDWLNTVAELKRSGSTTRVELLEGHSLGDLEAALAPILPARDAV